MPGPISLVSVTTDGLRGNTESGAPALSADARFVVFEGALLASQQTTATLFGTIVHDRQTGTTEALLRADGLPITGHDPVITPDGRFVAFWSEHALLPRDSNSGNDVYLFDRQTRSLELVSVTDGGGAPNNRSYDNISISDDGNLIAFSSFATNLDPRAVDSNGTQDLYVHNRAQGQTILVSHPQDSGTAAGITWNAVMTADGRFAAFDSAATTLARGDGNRAVDVFVANGRTGAVDLVSVSTGGRQGNNDSFDPALSANGRFVAFTSAADNLVRRDTNGLHDIFVHDRATGETTRVSLSSDGAQGRAVGGPGFIDSRGSFNASISGDGRFVVFESDAAGLVAGDRNGLLSNFPPSDVFVHDRLTGQTRRVSLSEDGGETREQLRGSFDSRISADGRQIVFVSDATDLIETDDTRIRDIYVAANPLFDGRPAGVGRTGGPRGDTLAGTARDDLLDGGAGNDRLSGRAGMDQLAGGSGDDGLAGGEGFDFLDGGAGRDTLAGDQGHDRLLGGAGRDRLAGGSGADRLFGGSDHDSLLGGDQDDRLYGEGGNDRLDGGAGNDRLTGGSGNDVLAGGDGADLFLFRSGADADTVTGFVRSGPRETADRLAFDGSLWGDGPMTAFNLVRDFARAEGGDTVFDFGNGDRMALAGVAFTLNLASQIDLV